MAFKEVNLEDIGTVRLYKHRKARSIKLSISANYVRVSLPSWIPYKAGLEFVNAKREWILKHKTLPNIAHNNDPVGKHHHLQLIGSAENKTVATRVTNALVRVTYPAQLPYYHSDVQSAARRASQRALKQEAERLLPMRLNQLARKYNYSYNSVVIKRLSSRWGSCNQQKKITLNYYLMLIPWQLIDYVLLHELNHTKNLNHSKVFWDDLKQHLPNVRQLRSELKTYQPYI